MSRAAAALALSLTALPALAQQQNSCLKGQTLREIDPESGSVILKTRLTPKPDSFDPLLVWTSDEPDTVTFVVMGNAENPKYGSCHRMALMADGRPVALGAPRYDGALSGARTLEYVASDMTWIQAGILASAKTVTYTVCQDDRQASLDFVCQAKEVIEAAAAWKKEQAAKPADTDTVRQ